MEIAVLLFVCMLVVALVYVLWLSDPDRGERDSEALVFGHADQWIQDAVVALSGMPKHTFSQPAPRTLLVSRTVRPRWTVVVAILLFPIGLLALAVTRTVDGTIAVTETTPGHLHVRFRGCFDGEVITRVNTVIERTSLSPATTWGEMPAPQQASLLPAASPSMTTACPNGHAVPAGSRFCLHCGAAVG